MELFRTYIKCHGCSKKVSAWYDMKSEGEYCIPCFIDIFPELVSDEDLDRLDDLEKE